MRFAVRRWRSPVSALVGHHGVRAPPQAHVAGGYVLADCSADLAADAGSITVGAHTNIQDHCMIRTGLANLGEHDADTVIGDRVTVGHRATLHGVTLEDEVLVGMASTLQHGVKVGTWGAQLYQHCDCPGYCQFRSHGSEPCDVPLRCTFS